MEPRLTPEESATLERIEALGSQTQRRRARLLLLWDEGVSTREIAARVELSTTQVYRWLGAFAAKRLAIFPADLLAAASVSGREADRSEEAGAPAVGRQGPGVLPDDAMSEAGRKVLRLHFERMLQREAGARRGEDIEELHRMRVATRRMRTAFRVFEPYFDPDVLRPSVKGLRRTGRALGRVRDLDVIMAKAEDYLGALPLDERSGLDPLLAHWKRQRQAARERLLDLLNGQRYLDFLEDLRHFVYTEGAGAALQPADGALASHVRQAVPALIRNRYDVVRGYDSRLSGASLETLHALRIDCKLLRYTMEFFREVLAPVAEDAIEEVVTVQDYLGELNDADVASQVVIRFLANWRNVEGGQEAEMGGVIRYLAARQNELHELLEPFPEVWRHFSRPEIRRLLARLGSAE
jgi:CHAD domain-containing protein